MTTNAHRGVPYHVIFNSIEESLNKYPPSSATHKLLLARKKYWQDRRKISRANLAANARAVHQANLRKVVK